MTDAAVHCLWPAPGDDLDDEDIARLYEMGTVAADGAARPAGASGTRVAGYTGTAAESEVVDGALAGRRAEGAGDATWVRANFVSSLDGAATHAGLSGGLSDAADRRVFGILRRLCDVVVVGAGTVRAEGYGAMRVDPESARWRREHGRAEQPVFAIVSATLDLDPSAPIFAEAPVRPVVLTVASAPESARRALSAVAEVVDCGDGTHVDTAQMVRRLAERGLQRIHCEGGPHLFGAMVAEGTVDELCLTLSARLEGGDGQRIAVAPASATAMRMSLAHVLAAGDTLLLRYRRSCSGAVADVPSAPSIVCASTIV
jgi:riboflavin biosynthesis pyrimidine reductase